MALSLHSAVFGYDPSHPVLRGVSVTLSPGRLVAIIGPNGAGKSTLLRLLAGLRNAQSGDALYDGQAISNMSIRERAQRLVYLPQQSTVAFDYTVREVVEMGAYSLAARSPEAATSSLRTVGLLERSEEAFRILSAGQQQRVSLARALAQLGSAGLAGARYLLADEPVSAMDPHHAIASMGLLRAAVTEGVGVAVVLHDLSLALRFADEVVLLDADGQVYSAGPTGETLTPGALHAIFGLGFERLCDSSGSPAAFVAITR